MNAETWDGDMEYPEGTIPRRKRREKEGKEEGQFKIIAHIVHYWVYFYLSVSSLKLRSLRGIGSLSYD
jgi:hypothetical protein